MLSWFEFFDVLDKKEDESEYKDLFVQNVLIALQAYLRKGGSEQEIRNLTRKPMIKVAICLLYNSKCIDLQYDEKRVLSTTKQEICNTFSMVFLPTGVAAIAGICTFGREFLAAALAD